MIPYRHRRRIARAICHFAIACSRRWPKRSRWLRRLAWRAVDWAPLNVSVTNAKIEHVPRVDNVQEWTITYRLPGESRE